MLLIIQLALIVAVINVWFSMLRRPGEILSFYDKSLIELDKTNPILHKMLTCSLCHTGYMAIITIIILSNIQYDHIDLLILPFSMVLFSIINKYINE